VYWIVFSAKRRYKYFKLHCHFFKEDYVKKFALVLMVLLAIGGVAFAAPKADSKKAAPTKLEPLVGPGDLVATVGIGWGGISGGVEFNLAQVDIAKVIPLTFGVAARASIDPFFLTYTTLGAGVLGTAHVGFKDLNLPDNLHWLSNVDSYIGLGLGLATALNDYYKPGIGFSTFEGVSYYLNENLAISFEYGYLGRVLYKDTTYGSWAWSYYYSTIGVTFKL
jgi:hypothetical protein